MRDYLKNLSLAFSVVSHVTFDLAALEFANPSSLSLDLVLTHCQLSPINTAKLCRDEVATNLAKTRTIRELIGSQKTDCQPLCGLTEQIRHLLATTKKRPPQIG